MTTLAKSQPEDRINEVNMFSLSIYSVAECKMCLVVHKITNYYFRLWRYMRLFATNYFLYFYRNA